MIIPELKKLSKVSKTENTKRRANELNGSDWVKNSISIWSDIRFSAEEKAFRHPAMFPEALPDKLLRTFTSKEDRIVFDPFCGSGSTVVSAVKQGKVGIGFELYDKFIKIAEDRLHGISAKGKKDFFILQDDCRNALKYIPENTVDFAFTSPPYWDILKQKRTADLKESEDYGGKSQDLGNEENYLKFLDGLKVVFEKVHAVLKPKKYFIVNVMDLRKGPQFFPLHIDAINSAEEAGFFLDDIIIWDRRLDYNNLRALGYPAVFRVNKVHEFLLVFRKPESQRSN
jgi:DNA modification methylase